MTKKEISVYADDYFVSQHPTRAFDYNGKKMTWKRAFLYTLFDSFFFGLKYAVLLIFFIILWHIVDMSVLQTYATNVCPLIK